MIRISFNLLTAVGLSVFGVCTSIIAAPVQYVTEDHLVPFDPEIDGALRPLLEEKLIVAPADCALSLIRRPDKGERAIALYKKTSVDGVESFCVTVVRASASLESVFADNGGAAAAVLAIPVRRCDAEISSSTAIAIRSAWAAMLRQIKVPEVYARPTLHREEIEFSIRDGSETNTGALPNKGGLCVSTLTRLAKDLEMYCETKSEARPDVANRLERRAKKLLRLLEAKGSKANNNIR
jgi:hypothetical protein